MSEKLLGPKKPNIETKWQTISVYPIGPTRAYANHKPVFHMIFYFSKIFKPKKGVNYFNSAVFFKFVSGKYFLLKICRP